jgi:hypothetical protein
MRVDARDLTLVVGSGGKQKPILHSVSFSIAPREFVAAEAQSAYPAGGEAASRVCKISSLGVATPPPQTPTHGMVESKEKERAEALSGTFIYHCHAASV